MSALTVPGRAWCNDDTRSMKAASWSASGANAAA